MFFSQDPNDANKGSASKRTQKLNITAEGAGSQEFALVIVGEQKW